MHVEACQMFEGEVAIAPWREAERHFRCLNDEGAGATHGIEYGFTAHVATLTQEKSSHGFAQWGLGGCLF